MNTAKALLVTGLAATGLAPAASAATRTIDFENALPLVTTQYSSQGIEFGRGPLGRQGNLPVRQRTTAANSGSYALGGITNCTAGEFGACRLDLWGRFTQTTQSHMHFYIGQTASGHSAEVDLQIDFYDKDGKWAAVQSITVPPSRGISTRVCAPPQGVFLERCSEVHQPGRYAYFHITSNDTSGKILGLAIDDVSFYEPEPGAPLVGDFSLLRTKELTEEVGVQVGGSTELEVKINRIGPVGDLDFAIEQPGRPLLRVPGAPPPAQITGTFEPNPARQRVDSVKLILKAGGGSPRDRVPVEIVARRRDARPGQKNEDRIRLSVTVVQQWDLEIAGMMVLPAVQSASGLATVSGARYTGVPLPTETPTVVRVLPALVAGPAGGIPAFMDLKARRADGTRLPGPETIYPLVPSVRSSVTDVVRPKSQVVVGNDLPQLARGFTFILPEEWTAPGQEITLIARIYPQVPDAVSIEGAGIDLLADPEPLQQCRTSLCFANDRFELRGVSFARSVQSYNYPTIRLFTRDANGNPIYPMSTEATFRRARSLIPSAGGLLIYPAAGAGGGLWGYDISEAVSECQAQEDCDDGLDARLVVDYVLDFKDDTEFALAPTGVIGIVDGLGVAGVSVPDRQIAVVQDQRPLTSVAHELSHLLDQFHTDTQCGGNSGDQVGFDLLGDGGFGSIQTGFLGLDTSQPLPDYQVVSAPAPSTTKTGAQAPAAPLTGRYFDYMSYCAANGPEADVWIAPEIWTSLLGGFTGREGFASPRIAAEGGTGPVDGFTFSNLRVSGTVTDGGKASIRQVRASSARVERHDPDAAYRLVVRGSQGTVLANVPMAVSRGHVDGKRAFSVFSGEAPRVLGASLRAAGRPATVEVMRGGTPIATRTRSPHTPRVRLRGFRRGQRVGLGKTFTVRWRARDTDGDPLTSKIDFSPDDGRTWRTLVSTPHGRSVRLSSRLLESSRRARIRVRVNDGFNDGIAVSQRFIAVGRGPRVRIVAPTRRTRAQNDAPLVLEGSAIDENGSPIRRSALRWYAGRRLIARGRFATAARLPAGRVRIRLLAKGRAGRTGRADVVVRITAAPPRLRHLKLVSPLSPRSRRARLKLAASVPSALIITGPDVRQRRARLQPQSTTVTVKIHRRAHRPLRLTLRLRNGRKVGTVRLAIPRR